MKRVASVVVMLVELVVLGYATFMAFLLTVWIETHSFADRATEIDWWIEAGKRLFSVGMAAAIFGAIVLAVNMVVFRWLGFENRRFAAFSAGAAFLLIVAAGIAGAINFVVSKPFI